ncbi:MAG TPA: hypothetical protein VMD53_18670, partial [Rhizomicrobium sp.]|nr:hypothetical protein [Rhizomicrobium sp.]
ASFDALTLIKILRPILPGRRLQKHLTDCAAYEVLIRAFEPYHPPLRLGHVLGLAPLPRRGGAKILMYPALQRVNRTVFTDDHAADPNQPVA